MSHEMEIEDYYHQCKAECAALREQVDNLVAMIRVRDERIATQDAAYALKVEQVTRLTLALDDALGIVRGIKARDEALKAEAEALEL